MPGDDVLQRVGEAPAGLPAEAGASLRDVELQVVGLMRMTAAVELPAGAPSPVFDELFDDPLNGAGVLVARAEVPALREVGAVLPQTLRQCEVAGQRLQDVLP